MFTRNVLIDLIHLALNNGIRVIHPFSPAYEFISERILKDARQETREYQASHFATRDNRTLALRCTDNWFGGLVHLKDIPESHSFYNYLKTLTKDL